MKIAILRKTYNPYGGAERYLHLLTDHLVRGGHQVHVYAHRWPSGKGDGVIFHRVPMIGGLSLLKVWSFAAASWWKLRGFRNGVIFSNERTFRQDLFRASDGVHATWLRIRNRHASPLKRISFAINPLHLSVRFLDRHIFRRRAFRRIIAPSEFIKQDILKNYPEVRPEEIRVIYNGVDLDRFHPANRSKYRDAIREELNVLPSTPLLLFIGTGFERKGLRYAIEALAHLPEEAVLAVIGKGRQGEYRALADRLGIASRVRFLGPVDGTERYYGAADLLVLPTLYEPMANVVLEALASGLPVVTSRECGNREVLTEGEDGWIVDDPRDSRELARKIDAALTSAPLPETAARARRKAERFTLQRTVTEIEGVLRELQGGPRFLFLLEGRNTPSSRLRVDAYLPFLEKKFDCRKAYIPGSFFKRLRFLLTLPESDGVFLQKKLFRPWELALAARKGGCLIYDLDDAVIHRDREESNEEAVPPAVMDRFRKTIQRSAAVIAGNPTLAESVRPWAGRVEILPTPVDLRLYTPKTRYPRTTDEPVIVGWVGTRGNLRYLHDLAPVFLRLSERHPQLRIKILCDAPADLPGVPAIFKRWVQAEEPEELRGLDIGVMPLRDTPWTRGKCGYKILQYMAAGVPAVASPVGFNRTLIRDGENGFLADSPEGWFSALDRLIEDPGLRERLGTEGRKTVERDFSLEQYAPRFGRILEEALGRAS